MLAFLAFFSHAALETPVRATLSDGQILMGEVKTRTLRLDGGAGLLDIPIEDIGEVVPTGDLGLGESEGFVTVWLRNGSELRGRWSEPKLAMAITVGGADVPVDLPMNELGRFQLQSDAAWPTQPVFRMKTTFGDDFLVDPARTRLVVHNQLGTFSPLLAECQSASPVQDPTGDWRIVLRTGTVLIGQLEDQAVTVALPMGPEEVTVPLANFVSLHLESWGQPVYTPPATLPTYAYPGRPYEEAPMDAPMPNDDERREERSDKAAGVSYAAPVAPAAARSAGATPAPSDGWFDRSALDAAKDASGG